MRWNDYWNKDEGRKEWDLLKEYDFYYVEEFGRWMRDTSMEYMDSVDFGVYDYPAGAEAFAERTLPRLKQLISKELEKEVHSA